MAEPPAAPWSNVNRTGVCPFLDAEFYRRAQAAVDRNREALDAWVTGRLSYQELRMALKRP